MSKKNKYIVFLFTLFSVVFSYSQFDDSKGYKTLQEKITENKQLLITNASQAYFQIDELLEQAIQEDNHDAELTLLSNRCYYLINNDLKKALDATIKLQIKAKAYKNIYYQATAHEYFSNIYLKSELPDKALEEFNLGIKLLNKINNDSKTEDIVHLKSNAYTVANDAYRYKGESKKAAQMLLHTNNEIKKLNNSEKKRLLSRVNYTNLGGIYLKINIDSAEYFINQSLLLSNEIEKSDIIQFNNYLHLGYINKEKKDYSNAISSYKKAESKIPYINPTFESIDLIYRDLSEIYKNTDSLEQENEYLQKLQFNLLQQEKNKNQSLHKIIDEELLKDKNYSLFIAVGSGILLIWMSFFMIRLYKKNKLLVVQEKVSEEYLKEHEEEIKVLDNKDLLRLLEMVKSDDKSFMIAFHNSFPKFLEKLQAIHPKIVPTEVEFCALLKLNLSTKDIARYTNIEPKSVQNKKYRIRKKLNIPDDVDIYFWFNKF